MSRRVEGRWGGTSGRTSLGISEPTGGSGDTWVRATLNLTLPPFPSTFAPPPPPLTMQVPELIASKYQGPQNSPRGSHSWHHMQVVIGHVQMAELRQILRGGGDKDSLLDQTLARLL